MSLFIGLGLSILCKLLIGLLHLWPGHAFAAAVLFTAPDIWILAGILIPNTSWIFPVIRRFATDRDEVWLTIDDGPEPATTPALLALLERHQAKVTFFVIGEKTQAHPELIREILRRGHSIGNHTQHHPVGTFWLAGLQRTRAELEGCVRSLHLAAVPRPEFFRPPAGIKSLFLGWVLAEHDTVMVGWSGRGREQLVASTAAPLRRLKRHVRPGAILLVHESGRHAVHRIALLNALLDHLDRNGYRCVLPTRDSLRF